jgi:hypothetical protein
VVKTLVDLGYRVSLVQMIVALNYFRFHEVRKIDFFLQELLDNLLSLGCFEGVEALPPIVIELCFDEGCCVQLGKRGLDAYSMSALQEQCVGHADANEDLRYAILICLKLVADEVSAFFETKLHQLV